MGRTITPYSIQMQMVEDRLKDFKRALRRDDRERFERLMRAAKVQPQAGVLAASPLAIEPMAFSIMIELQREIDSLGERVRSLETQLVGLELDQNPS